MEGVESVTQLDDTTHLLESRGAASGAWRGEVSNDSPSNVANQRPGGVS
jgi:hypothetical protein